MLCVAQQCCPHLHSSSSLDVESLNKGILLSHPPTKSYVSSPHNQSNHCTPAKLGMDILTGVAFRNNKESSDGAFLVSAKVPHNGRESATLSMAAQALAAFAASAASGGGGGIIGC